MGGFLALSVILFSICACGKQSQGARNVVIYEGEYDREEAAELTLENEFLKLRFVPQTAEIILMDKVGGAEWHSNPVGRRGEDQLSDTVTRQLMESQFSLEYADVSGVGMTLYSGLQSVELGAFQYVLDGDCLEVSYTVGDLARTYVIPPAAPEDRMLSFLEKMDSADRSFVLTIYRLYDINNLRSTDNRAELLGKYPDLTRRKIYVLRGDAVEFVKADSESYFAAAGYTYDDYREDTNRYPSTSTSEKPAFNITLRYRLEGKSLVLTVPFDRMAYRPAYPMTQLTLMPYMGAGGINDKGYLLVPDGSGALIYFNNGKQNQTAYSNPVYGWDEAMPRLGGAIINDNKAPYPAFGIQKNGNALVCVIEEGAAYASIRADVSGRNSLWNNVYPHFDLIHGATMDIASRTERAVYLYEGGLPAGENIVLRYTPCDSGGYAGMAKEYRSWLVRKYPSLAGRTENGVPIAIEIPGAVNKTQHRIGIPFDLPLKLTSYKEANGMIDDFAGFGWRNVRIKLNGWFNRSVDHSIPTKVKLISALGSKRDFRELLSSAQKNGYEVFPEADFLFLRDKKAFDGFSLYRDAARYINRKRIEKYPYSFVWFGERTRWGKLSYLARPAYMMSLIDGFRAKTAKLGLRTIAFRSIASTLSGDYNEKRLVSREGSMIMRQEKLAELSGGGTGILLNTGFAYAAPWADFITDMAIDDQGFGITDVSVPFYPMVLHGLVPYTGRAINLAEDYTKNLLKTIESGAGLYFSFMTEETAVLQETKVRQAYANEYGKWVMDADALYRRFSNDFAGLYAQAITDHVILTDGVTLTEYEDGTSVIVNAGSGVWRYPENPDIVIKANDYVVLRRGN
jgi:hypothetical protein